MPDTLCPICPKCGGEGECFCLEVGSADNYKDEYTFVCKKNKHITKKIISGGSTTGENWLTECPFCKKSSKEHLSTPKKFQ